MPCALLSTLIAYSRWLHHRPVKQTLYGHLDNLTTLTDPDCTCVGLNTPPPLSLSLVLVVLYLWQGHLQGGEDWLANPALPEDVVRETVPGESPRRRRACSCGGGALTPPPGFKVCGSWMYCEHPLAGRTARQLTTAERSLNRQGPM